MHDAIVLIVIASASFVGACISACFSVGGGYVLFAATTGVLPLQSAIALQSVLSFGSLFSRTHAFWHEIEWPIVRSFTAGSLVGVTAGLWAFSRVPTGLLALMVAVLLWALAWMPPPRTVTTSRTRSFAAIGIVHASVSTLLGLGAILQPALLRTTLSRTAIVGTFATCLILLELIRTAGYAANGFAYGHYWREIAAASCAGLAGTYVGKRIPSPVSEAAFRMGMRLFVTGLGANILYRGTAQWFS